MIRDLIFACRLVVGLFILLLIGIPICMLTIGKHDPEYFPDKWMRWTE